ncbi:hypothetical protein K490DRAFT_64889 [Saccharata proteae CBS 121410]|uniref:J domain-containing protein n=1 Tax=Saccharata proteae CBS 121410 TaxID=1314787 RepID=A0A9P4HXD9_9PEZI|nr:hypothetical protein K490DRAFT_64889 [Saccharata proteae CBS 121410]
MSTEGSQQDQGFGCRCSAASVCVRCQSQFPILLDLYCLLAYVGRLLLLAYSRCASALDSADSWYAFAVDSAKTWYASAREILVENVHNEDFNSRDERIKDSSDFQNRSHHDEPSAEERMRVEQEKENLKWRAAWARAHAEAQSARPGPRPRETHEFISTRNNHCEILGLGMFPTRDEISASYRKLSLIHHPDRNPNDSGSHQRMQIINEAYEKLMERW